MNPTEAGRLVDAAIAAYPAGIQPFYRGDRPRLVHDVALALSLGVPSVVDLGSGFSPFALALRLAGLNARMMDMFDYIGDVAHGVPTDAVLHVLAKHDVTVTRWDLQRDNIPPDADLRGLVTCLAVLEHFHRSPRPFLTSIRARMPAEGYLLLSCPNAVNLRKRVSVVIGRTNYPPIQNFWTDGDPVWHGHVREPTLSDLGWMTQAAGFQPLRAFGRNFVGLQNYPRAAAILDPVLQAMPGLCSDIYVLSKPART